MLEKVFRKQSTIQSYRDAPIVGPFVDSIADELAELGYVPQVIRTYVRGCKEFGFFLVENGVAPQNLRDDHVEAFLAQVTGRRTRGTSAIAVRIRRPAAKLLLARMRREGIAAELEHKPTAPQAAAVLSGYSEYLHQHRGISERTVRDYRLHVSRFLDHISVSTEPLSRVTPQQIDGFLVDCGRRMCRRTMVGVSTALRSFFRYLYVTGELSRDLSAQIATPRIYALETVPRAVSWSDALRVLSVPDRSTVTGRRDYAILVLLLAYGVRAGECMALTLSDVDWRSDRIRVRHTKNGVVSWYPLHHEVGAAIADYLRHGRPVSPWPQIFLTVRAPPRPFARSTAVSWIVSSHLRRAGVEISPSGAHTLRHSRALHLLRQGFSLKAIGDVLGHRHPQSTFIYTKAALDDLRPVGLEVTEVLP